MKKSSSKLSLALKKIGLIKIIAGIVFGLSLYAILVTFGPVIKAELQYKKVSGSTIPNVSVLPKGDNITPVNPQFGIVIPKIRANAPVIADVNPFDSKEYQQQLALGVAHAKDTVLPGEPGNSFLFAHSAGDVFMSRRYNAVFYLLNKLETGDKIYISREEKIYTFKVTEIEEVLPTDVEYLTQSDKSKQTITLMTCTPAGTTLRRLLVHAELVPDNG